VNGSISGRPGEKKTLVGSVAEKQIPHGSKVVNVD
jgi:hypothetical protein